MLKCAVMEVDPALFIPFLERSQQIEQDPPHGAGSSCLGSHTAFELCQRRGREIEQGCAAGGKSPPKNQGNEEIPLIHGHMNPWLFHHVLRCIPTATHIPRQIIHKNINKTRTVMETTLCLLPPQLQDRWTLLQGQTHTMGIALHG